MSVLRALKKLVLGETWLLPAGVAALMLLSAFIFRPLLSGDWRSAGGFVILIGAVGILLTGVGRSAARS